MMTHPKPLRNGKVKNVKSPLKSWALVALACALLMSACSKNSGGASDSPDNNGTNERGQTSSAGETGSESDDPFAKHLEITWLGYNAAGVIYPEDHETKAFIEEKFNVTIINPKVDIFNDEQVHLYFAEGKTADLISLKTMLYSNLIDQGVFREVDLDQAREKMPNYFKKLESTLDYETIKARTQYNGKNWSIPYSSYTSFTPHIMAIRQDWMDNLGLKNTPATLDEFEDLIRKFTFDDPDRNGKNDTYGIHGVPLYVFGAFGIPVTGSLAVTTSGLPFHVDEDGKVFPVAITENKKALLKKVAEWYKEGLIDPESITDDRAKQRAKWKEGKFGILVDNPWWFAYSTKDNLSDMPKQIDPNAELTFIKPFQGPFGKGSSRGFATVAPGFYFGKDITQEKMDRIMAIKEHIASDDDLYIRLFFGEEGKHFDFDQEGKIIVKPEYANSENVAKAGLGQFYALIPLTLDFAKTYLISEREVALYETSFEAEYYPSDVNFRYQGVNEALIKYQADLNTIVSEFDVKAITGKIDIDAEWDGFVRTFMNAGGQQVVDEYQRLYDESN